jgi:predicted nucleotidyltransferase
MNREISLPAGRRNGIATKAIVGSVLFPGGYRMKLDMTSLNQALKSLKQTLLACEDLEWMRAFGSRANGQAKEYSDLGLVVIGTERLPQEVYFQLLDAFGESDLPIRVDVVD